LLLRILNVILPFLYLSLTLRYAWLFARSKGEPRIWTRALSPALLAPHLGFLILLGIRHSSAPITSLPELMSVLAFALAAIYFYVEWRMRNRSSGVFVLGLSFLAQAVSSLRMDLDAEKSAILLNPLTALHAFAAAFGYAAFIVAFIYGLLYLLQRRHIRLRRFGLFFERMPSLEELDEMNCKAATAGFAFMTLSLLVGGWWLSRSQVAPDVSFADPKIIVAFFIWAVFGAIFALKRFFGRGGGLTATLSIVGFLLLLFSMLVVDAIFSTFHIFN
jgi:ABC-type uncharacterized transport system permease subunit